jgi:hypothetical protein
MSRVTNVILTAHVSEEIEPVNRFLQTHEAGGGGKFIEVTGHAGGYKHMECSVYLSAFNHADTNVILEAIEQAPWRDRSFVQLFIKEQEEEGFRRRWYGETLSENIAVELSREEFKIIHNALNEVCFGLDMKDEFESRVGAKLNTALSLMARLAGY